MWSGVIAPEMLQAFEKKTGIKLHVSYYGGNEELLVKLLATQGAGYDLIVPSDYVVEYLIKHNLLKKIDKTKLTFYDALHPAFLGHYFDPHNDYSLPSDWYIVGIGINKQFVEPKEEEHSWSLVFDPQGHKRFLGVLNDSREMITLAMLYKFGSLQPLDLNQEELLIKLLQKQKRYVHAYTDFRADFLLESGSCSVVIVPNSYCVKSMEKNSNIDFIIPREGTFLNIENYVIPASCTHEQEVYELINFLFDPQVQEYNYRNGTFLSTRSDADYLAENPYLSSSLALLEKDFEHPPLYLFKNYLTDAEVNKIWLAVKG